MCGLKRFEDVDCFACLCAGVVNVCGIGVFGVESDAENFGCVSVWKRSGVDGEVEFCLVFCRIWCEESGGGFGRVEMEIVVLSPGVNVSKIGLYVLFS